VPEPALLVKAVAAATVALFTNAVVATVVSLLAAAGVGAIGD